MVPVLSLISIWLLAFPSFAYATRLAGISIEELLKQANYVAVVRIDAGETLWAGDRICGAKYKGAVLDAIKGLAKDDKLEWDTADNQNYSELEIGTRYLIFLTKPGKRYDPMASTNSWQQEQRAEFEQRCGALLSGNRTMHTGFGTMIVEHDKFSNATDRAKVRTFFIELPQGINAEPIWEKGASIDSWVKLEDLVSYLKSLKY